MTDKSREEAGDLSPRGFLRMTPVDGAYGGHVQIYESSAASGPHVWLKVEEPDDLNAAGIALARGEAYNGPSHDATVHLPLKNLLALRDQINEMERLHYQLIEGDDD